MRSNADEIAHEQSQHHTPHDGVGGRQAHPYRQPGGGGYLETCTVLKPRAIGPKKTRDPRLDELRAMGLHHTWQKVAAAIGVDAFLVMWRILDAEPQFHDPRGNLEVPIRRYRSYQRYQRNQYIRQLHSAGLKNPEIAARLEAQFGERLDQRSIMRIISSD